MENTTRRPSLTPQDVKLTQRIAEFLYAQEPREFVMVQIVVRNAEVTVQGIVRTEQAKLAASKHLSKVTRVRAIHNELVVDEAEFLRRHPAKVSPVVALFNRLSVGQLVAAGAILIAVWIGMPAARAWLHVEEKPPLETYPIVLDVFQGDKPATGAQVVLHAQKHHHLDVFIPRPTGIVDAKGRARIRTFQPDDGAPVGEYILTIKWHKLVVQGEDSVQGPNLVDEKFSVPGTSPFRVVVHPKVNQVPPLTLAP